MTRTHTGPQHLRVRSLDVRCRLTPQPPAPAGNSSIQRSDNRQSVLTTSVPAFCVRPFQGRQKFCRGGKYGRKALRHLQQPPHVATSQQPLHEGPDISHLKPHLQQQWDQAANAHLGSIVIKPYSNKTAQWVCDRCPDGHPHVWQTRVLSRTSGSGCPYCSGNAVCCHNSLATKAPDVASYWDNDKNELTPHNYTSKSNVHAHWRCPTCLHQWTARIGQRVMTDSRCPQCTRERPQHKTRQPSLAACGPSVMALWDQESNVRDGLDPAKITLKSHTLVNWVCFQCPVGVAHRWQASPNSRFSLVRRYRGCPCCTGQKVCKCNSLQAMCPEIAADWDFANNDRTPDDYTVHSNRLVWWSNAERGSWQARISHRKQAFDVRQARG